LLNFHALDLLGLSGYKFGKLEHYGTAPKGLDMVKRKTVQRQNKSKRKTSTNSAKVKPARKTGKKNVRARVVSRELFSRRSSGGSITRKNGLAPLKFIRTNKEIKKYLAQAGSRRRKVALVPTMGYLHEGHLSLVREARRLASLVVVTVFVNPTQFGPTEDLDRYPRDISGDRRKLRREGASLMFVPDTPEIYPDGFQTYIEVTDVTRDFCGASRQGHFRGVTTVVGKLFNVIRPDMAIFGEKDFQQLVAVRRMVADLNMEVEVVGMPTVREEDGLAMSSRNAYLSPAQRQQATALFRGLTKARRLLDSGERDAAELAAVVLDLLREEQDIRIEYVAVCDPLTLDRIPEVEHDAVLMAAIRIGDTRLIDNIRLNARKSRRSQRK